MNRGEYIKLPFASVRGRIYFLTFNVLYFDLIPRKFKFLLVANLARFKNTSLTFAGAGQQEERCFINSEDCSAQPVARDVQESQNKVGKSI